MMYIFNLLEQLPEELSLFIKHALEYCLQLKADVHAALLAAAELL